LKSEVLALERALVEAATRGAELPVAAVAVWGAVASRYLAVGTPRSFGIIGDGAESLEAHRTWFAPTDVRCTDAAVAGAIGARVVPIEEALAADIVCVHAPVRIAARQLRRGTHVNALALVEVDREVVAEVTDVRKLAEMAAGLIDGRQLDEITIFVADGG
jgi:ornithine cyclodeaminase/alanine dehydrogenase-like protein (mu-crystallin family)